MGTNGNPPYYVYGDDGVNGLGYYYPVFLNTEGLSLTHQHIIGGKTYFMPNSEVNHAQTSFPNGYNRAPDTQEAPTNTAYYVYGDDGKWGEGYYYPVHLYNHDIGNFHQHIINGITYYMPSTNAATHASPVVPESLGLQAAPQSESPEEQDLSFEYYSYSGSINGVFTRICETVALSDEDDNPFSFAFDFFNSNTTLQIPQDFKCTYIEHSKLFAKIERII